MLSGSNTVIIGFIAAYEVILKSIKLRAKEMSRFPIFMMMLLVVL
jgi:hypothetical protein